MIRPPDNMESLLPWEKIEAFEKSFRYELIDVDDKVRIVVPGWKTSRGKDVTYNPDYFCPQLNCYIELTATRTNCSKQGKKWCAAIAAGMNLKIYNFLGKELTLWVLRVYGSDAQKAYAIHADLQQCWGHHRPLNCDCRHYWRSSPRASMLLSGFPDRAVECMAQFDPR